MPLQATSGAASYDAFGGGVPVVPQYIEEVFSTYLYTGNAGTQTVTNGIDLSTKGGMVWIKSRSGAFPHNILDTARGFNYSGTQTRRLDTAATDTEADAAGNATQASPLTDGFSVTTSGGGAINFYNASGSTYASWTFRKQAKFFDVVTWTGNGPVTHNLGTTPGFWVYKDRNVASDWFALARKSDGTYEALYLNKTDATAFTGANAAAVGLTATTFDPSLVFGSAAGRNYVAYAFAHNAGGFGLTGTDNVISCGSYTGNGSSTGPEVNIGYEPQWLLIKEATQSGNSWSLYDNMRGLSVAGPSGHLRPNDSAAEDTTTIDMRPTATGFQPISSSGRVNRSGETFIYIAIRRGPMKVPTSGTSVFAPVTYAGNSAAQTITAGFRVDMELVGCRTGGQGWEQAFADRLRGNGRVLSSASTGAEVDWSANLTNEFQSNTGTNRTDAYLNFSSLTFVDWMFQRAPSFFDEVCYSGNSTAGRTLTHNLGVVPQLIIVKARTINVGWAVYAESAGNTKYSELNDVTRFTTGINCWNDTSPTASVFSLSSNARVNRTGDTYVAYLFATCAGVSKVGSYTGTGSLQTINCGFTSGARFVLIKNQNVNGDWYVWDSARGISSSNDPYLLLNSTAAEVTNTNYVDTDSTGFKVTGNTAVNTSSDTYIFLAIA